MIYTYVIKSKKDSKWYTGSARDLRKRFKQHSNNGVFSTKGRGPFELIYYEACINEQDARTREKYLKSGMGKRYLKNRLKRFLSLTGFIFGLFLFLLPSLAEAININCDLSCEICSDYLTGGTPYCTVTGPDRVNVIGIIGSQIMLVQCDTCTDCSHDVSNSCTAPSDNQSTCGEGFFKVPTTETDGTVCRVEDGYNWPLCSRWQGLGNWDASGNKCVQCSSTGNHTEAQVLGNSSTIYANHDNQTGNAGDTYCESACGANTACDEVTDGNQCTVGQYCEALGRNCQSGDTCSSCVCVPPSCKANGQTCSAGSDCCSGYCVNGYCCNSACGGNCDRCNVSGSLGACTNVDADCTGNCDVCSSGNCAADASKCTGNCDTCSGSSTSFSCAADATLCTGNCDICLGSGTSFNCAADNTKCSNTVASCYCSGSSTSFNCQSCSSSGCCDKTCSSYTCGLSPNTANCPTGSTCQTNCTCTGVNNPPTCTSLTPDKTSINVGETVVFTGAGSDSDGTISEYEFDFGDGSAKVYSSTAGTTHTYNTSGTFCAKLSVKDDDGAWSTNTGNCPGGTCTAPITVAIVVGISPPAVETLPINDSGHPGTVAQNSATVWGKLISCGGASIALVWFKWGPTTSMVNSTSYQTIDCTTASFPYYFNSGGEIAGLTANTLYYFEAFAKNGGSW